MGILLLTLMICIVILILTYKSLKIYSVLLKDSKLLHLQIRAVLTAQKHILEQMELIQKIVSGVKNVSDVQEMVKRAGQWKTEPSHNACAFTNCDNPRAEGKFVCSDHLDIIF